MGYVNKEGLTIKLNKFKQCIHENISIFGSSYEISHKDGGITIKITHLNVYAETWFKFIHLLTILENKNIKKFSLKVCEELDKSIVKEFYASNK